MHKFFENILSFLQKTSQSPNKISLPHSLVEKNHDILVQHLSLKVTKEYVNKISS